jgi:PAS domain S-box-containing protein/putative nucleotidyltransferase with HDIG domain
LRIKYKTGKKRQVRFKKRFSLKPGDHLSLFYNSDVEHRSAIISFLLEGLEGGERVIYILDSNKREKIIDYLKESGIDADPYIGGEQLVFITSEEIHLKGGIMDFLNREIKYTISQGYKVLRVTEEMSWLKQTGLKKLEFEAEINRFLPGKGCILMCQFDRRIHNSSILMDALRTHPVIVYKGEIYDNIYYISPEEFLFKDLDEVELTHRLNHLARCKKRDEVLQESEERYKNLFENARDVIITFDLKGNITSINRAVNEYGFDREKMIGKNMLKFVSKRYWPKLLMELSMIVRGKPIEGEIELITPSGRKIAEYRSNPIKMNNRVLGFHTIMRDITDRKRTETLLQALNKAAVAIQQALNPDEIFRKVSEELKKLGFSSLILIKDKNKLLLKYVSYDKRALKRAEALAGVTTSNFEIDIDALDIYKRVIYEKRTIFVENTGEIVKQILPKGAKELSDRIVKMLKASKSIAAPLLVEDEVIGILSVQSDDLTPKDVSSISAFSHQVATAWRKAKLLEDLKLSLMERKRTEEELQQSFIKLRRILDGTIQALISTVEIRDPYTAGHQRRVAQLASAIAREMNLPEEKIEGIQLTGLIHDIGKICIPSEILNKPGPLDEVEFNLVKAHPQTGYNILKNIEFPWPMAKIVLQHHERMDGSGYPSNLKGEEIILEARILGVADVVEAMSSHRPYRPAYSIDKALEEIKSKRGILYDPKVVDACLRLFQRGFRFE